MHRRFLACLLCAAALITGCHNSTDASPAGRSTGQTAGGQESTRASEVTVFAAASTRVITDKLGAVTQTLPDPFTVRVSNAGSTTLLQQLRDGAPADVLIVADESHMRQAEAEGLVTHGEAVANNTMVLVTPPDNPAGIRDFSDIDQAQLVVCAPEVPCGAVAAKLAAANNVALQPVSLEQSVSDVVGKVITGEADAGIVYATDAAAAAKSGKPLRVIPIPHAATFANTIMAAVTTTAVNQQAASQLVQLLGDTAFADVWAEFGFIPVNPTATAAATP
ncbi:molybdate ABC transporter substrate-binding protein [Corynebacterium choanae]|uniref:Molybdate-binding periplasmic protein n=1 Tax=Corynebacterium choanae TaxID=1862358 RepID=A0A3G6JBD4_9CORY|nr:molybdate ABC transporter substrate-binding protein [Corynebacterium choanae]AZA13424.1 Molybdate-binding periplasmic protein precursor [Corynebacterium choanae]